MKTRNPRVAKFGAVLALSLASAFATSAVAMASPVSHDRVQSNLVVRGTVTALTPSSGTPTSLTVQPENLARPSENILLSSSTVYMKGGVAVTIAALALGEPVRIALTGSPATAATVQIQAPRPVNVSGTVTMLTPSSGTPTSVTVQPRDSSTPAVVVALAANTMYYSGGSVTTVASLVVGSSVQIKASGTPLTAAAVYVAAPRPVFVNGTVTMLTPSSGTPTSLTVQPRDRNKAPLVITLGAGTLYYVSGVTTTVTSLVLGSSVQVMATGTPPTAIVVNIAAPRKFFINGIVTALTPTSGVPTSITVVPHEDRGVAQNILLGANTVYQQGGAAVSATALMLGSRVRIEASGSPATAATIYIAAPRATSLSGVVTALAPAAGTPTSVTVQPTGFFKAPVTVALGVGTTYMQLKATVTVAALLVGSHVELSASGNPLTATVVHISAPASDITVGSVTSVTDTSLTVQPSTTGAAPIIFTLSSSTMYFSGRRVATIAAVNNGDIVRVAAASTAPTSAVYVAVENMAIVGRVTGVVGNVISVRGFYGATLTVNVTTATVYHLGDRSSSLSAVVPGKLISAIGPALSGVTRSITATKVWIGARHNDILHDALMQHRDAERRHHR